MMSVVFYGFLCGLGAIVSGVGADRFLKAENYSPHTYYLRYSQAQYTWQEAKDICAVRGTVIATEPIPDIVLESYRESELSSSVWITNSRRECRTLKSVCVKERSSVFQGVICVEERLESEPVSCESRKKYLICQTAPTTTPTPTTTTTSTTTTPATTTTTTTSTTSTTTTTTTTPPTTTASTTEPTTAAASVTGYGPDSGRGGEGHTTQTIYIDFGYNPDGKKKEKKVEAAGCGGIATCFSHFLLGLSFGDKGLLGLIMAVVGGVFLITALCAVICCACHRTSSDQRRKRKYELVHGYSSSQVGGHPPPPPLSGPRTDTDDTSLDVSSDNRSQSLRQDEYYGAYPAIMPPPPPPVHDSPESPYGYYGDDERRFHSLQMRHLPIHAVDNNVYATINRYRKPSHSSVLDGSPLPLPPPPPALPPHDPPALRFSDDDDTVSRGLSQCSVVGCARMHSGHDTVGSRRTNGSDKRRSHRQASSLSSRRSSSSRRKSSRKGQSLELVSTNL